MAGNWGHNLGMGASRKSKKAVKLRKNASPARMRAAPMTASDRAYVDSMVEGDDVFQALARQRRAAGGGTQPSRAMVWSIMRGATRGHLRVLADQMIAQAREALAGRVLAASRRALDVAVELLDSEDEQVRLTAIQTVRKWFPDLADAGGGGSVSAINAIQIVQHLAGTGRVPEYPADVRAMIDVAPTLGPNGNGNGNNGNGDASHSG